MKIETAAVDSAEGRRLLAEMWREVDALYGNESATVSELTGMERAGAVFLIARSEGAAIGCVALRPRSAEIAEVKRMYVRLAARGSGVARQLMERLEEWAGAHGFGEIWLETGLKQPAAIRLYESMGYERIAAFGDYADDPANVCYGKRLAV